MRYCFLLLATATLLAYENPNDVWMKVESDPAPAGAVTQLRVYLTEPRPIVRSSLEMTFDEDLFDSILGISVAKGINGAARYANGVLTLAMAPAVGVFEVGEDYPLFTIAVRTKAGLPEGTAIPIRFNVGNSYWLNVHGGPAKQVYENGNLTISNDATLTVSNVIPGGGVIEAGQTFSIAGTGFESGLRVLLQDAGYPSVLSVTPTEIVVQAKSTFPLDGRLITVMNPGGARRAYYSYPRGTIMQPSAVDALQHAVPLFSSIGTMRSLAYLGTSEGMINAFGFLNSGAKPVTVTVSSPSIQTIAPITITLNPGDKMFQAWEEFAPAAKNAGPGYFAVFDSSGPIQMIHVVVDKATGEMRPVGLYNAIPADY
ncbi:MAG: IPT/TIG domain-containing protein [Bryobacterales bacterium]|nr:IPT/TIG domain-containing protein [Bryobacterales bacterium]